MDKKIIRLLFLAPIIIISVISFIPTSYGHPHYTVPYIIHNQPVAFQPEIPCDVSPPYYHPSSSMNLLNITCSIYDDYGLIETLIEENSTGTYIENDLTQFTLTQYYFPMNITSDGLIRYRFKALNADMRWTITPWYHITRDASPPTMVSHYPSPHTYTDAVNITADIQDFQNGIGSVYLNWSADGWVTNETILMDLRPAYYYVYMWGWYPYYHRSVATTVAAIPSHPLGTRVDLAIISNDKVNNTGIFYSHYIVGDDTPPNVTINSLNISKSDGIINVNLTASDVSGVNYSSTSLKYVLNSEENRTEHTTPLVSLSNDQYQATIPISSDEIVTFHIVVADNMGNEYVSESFSYTIAGDGVSVFNWWWLFVIFGIIAVGAISVRRYRSRTPEEEEEEERPIYLWEADSAQEEPDVLIGRFCEWCGEKIVQDAIFCSQCGASLEDDDNEGIQQEEAR